MVFFYDKNPTTLNIGSKMTAAKTFNDDPNIGVGAFSPALWRQRRNKAAQVFKEFNITKILDLGCGEGALIDVLINGGQATYVAGVDVDATELSIAIEYCQPQEYDKRVLREKPIQIELYVGNLAWRDPLLKEKISGIGCLEVVEHLYEQDLADFFASTLGFYQPEVMVVSTPNAEFNVYFPNLKYGTPEQTFRHDDHKFEWTRKEFQNWCIHGAETYGYDTTFSGVGILSGKEYSEAIGHCTQICVFKRTQYNNPLLPTKERYALVEKIDFPHFDCSKVTEDGIIKEVENFAKYVDCDQRFIVSSEYIGKSQKCMRVKLDYFWNILEIRQLCGGEIEKLLRVLGGSRRSNIVRLEKGTLHSGINPQDVVVEVVQR